MWVAMWAGLAQAGDLEAELTQKLAEIAPLRSQRIADGPPTFTADQYKRVAAGETVTGMIDVPGVVAKKVYGAIIEGVDIPSLWSAVNDEERQPGFTPIGYSEVILGTPCVSGRHAFQYLPLPLVSARWWITILTSNDALIASSHGSVRELAWASDTDPTHVTSAKARTMLPDAVPVGFTKGSWFLVSIDPTHTLIEYFVWTDPGGSVPVGLASVFATSSVADTLNALQKFALTGNPRCPKF